MNTSNPRTPYERNYGAPQDSSWEVEDTTYTRGRIDSAPKDKKEGKKQKNQPDDIKGPKNPGRDKKMWV